MLRVKCASQNLPELNGKGMVMTINNPKPVGINRRGFLKVGSGSLALSMTSLGGALQVAVVLEVAGAMLGQVGVDVFGGLLAADAKGAHQVVGREPAFPEADDFDEAVAEQQVPAGGPALRGGGLCCHGFILRCA